MTEEWILQEISLATKTNQPESIPKIVKLMLN